MILDTYHFLTIKQCAPLTPSFTPSAGGNVATAYVLLVRRKDGIRSLAQLAKHTIEIGTRGVQVMPRIWLDTVLAQNRLAPASTLFRSVGRAQNAGKAILNVLFGSTTACVVPQRAFSGAAELNPQVGQQLTALKTSVPYVEEFVFFSPHCPQDRATAIRSAALALHTKARGRQLMALFGVVKMVPFQKTQLRTARDLVRTYQAYRSAGR